MLNRPYRRIEKWSALCAVLALVAASGQACPPEMPPGPEASLKGLWTGTIGGEFTVNTLTNMPDPPNPSDQTTNSTNRFNTLVQIVFDEAGRPTALPLVLSAFNPGFSQQLVTAFNVGETQTLSSTNTTMSPSGVADTNTSASSITSTLTVVESVLTPDHFRVVYDTTNIQMTTQTSTAPGFMPSSSTFSSTGRLTFDAMAVGGLVVFSMDFNNNGTSEATSSGVTATGNGFLVGSLAGRLAAGTGALAAD